MATSIAFDIFARDRNASSTFDRVGNSASHMGGKLASAAKMGAFALAAVGSAAAVAAYKVGSDYVGSLNKIQALTGASDRVMNATAKTLEANASLYAKMGQTTGDAASGVVELTKAGMSLHNSLKAINSTMILAKAGEMSVADASTLVSNTLNTFSLKASQAGDIANYLANAANLSSADVSDLAESLKYVAPIAASSGVSLRQTSAILAELSNSGIKASQAGTGLRKFLISLESPSNGAQKSLDALGISIYDAHGKMLPFSTVVKNFTTAMNGMSSAEKNATLKNVFGLTGMTSAQVILKNGVKGLDDYTKGVGRAGAAQKLAEANSKGLAGTFAMLKAQVISQAQAWYRELSPGINDALLKTIAFAGVARTRLAPVMSQVGDFIATRVVPAVRQMSTWFQTKASPAIVELSQKVGKNLHPILVQLETTFHKLLPQLGSLVQTIKTAAPPILKLTGGLIVFASAVAGKVIPVAMKLAWVYDRVLLFQIKAVITGVSQLAQVIMSVGGVIAGAISKVAAFGASFNKAEIRVEAFARSIPGKVRSAVGNLGGLLFQAGQQVIQGLIDGIQSMVGSLTSKLGSITKLIPIHKGPIDKDRILLKPAGIAIMEGLIAGIDSKKVALQSVLDRVTASVQAAGSKLRTAIGNRDSFAAGFQSFSTSVFGADYGTDDAGNSITPTAASIIAAQRAQAAQAHMVKTDVRKLVKMGLSPALIKQLQAQGAAGIPEIQALAGASRADIRHLNSLNKQTSSDLRSAGMTAGDRIYGQQIRQDRRHYDDEKRLLGEIRDLLRREHESHHEVGELRIDGHMLVALLKKVQRTTGAKP